MNKPLDHKHPPVALHALGYEFDTARRIWARLGQDAFAYSDGDEVEQRIGAAVGGSADISLFSAELRKHQTDWPSAYHLSPVRANLLRPVACLFEGARILEVGAGCGAITRFLGEQGGRVLALEGSPRRAAIAAARCRDLANVTVVCDRFDAFAPDDRFDVISLIGVLEYARLYTDGHDPVQETLRKALSLLSDDGVLLVAIENQLGLKYFAGVHEDHLGRAMAGIQDHYDTGGVVTFGKVEIELQLRQAGFASAEFALPFPDYKLPQSIILPIGYAADSGFAAASLAGQAAHSDRQLVHAPLFSMGQVFGVLERNDLLPHLANSFLVLAGKSAASLSFASLAPGVLAAHYAADRQPEYTKATRFVREGDSIVAKRERMCPNVSTPSSRLISQVIQDEPYLRGINWEDRFEAIVSRPGWGLDELTEWLLTWRTALAAKLKMGPDQLSLDSEIPGALIDAVPRNLVVGENDAIFFDLEWVAKAPVSYGFLAFRAIRISFEHVTGVALPNNEVLLHVPTLVRGILRRMGLILTNTEIRSYLDIEACLQDEILGILRKAPDHGVIDQYILRANPDITSLLSDHDGSLSRAIQSLQEKDAAMDALRAQYDAAVTDLAGKQQHTRMLEKAVGDVQAELESAYSRAAQSLQENEAVLAAVRAEHKVASHELAGIQQHTRMLERSVGDVQAEFEQGKRNLAGKKQHIDVLELRIGESLRQEEQTRRRALHLEQELSESVADLSTLREAMSDAKRELGASQIRAAVNEELIAAMVRREAELLGDIESRIVTQYALEARNDELTGILREAKKDLAQLKATVADKDHEIHRLWRILDDLQKKAATQMEVAQQLDQELSQARHHQHVAAAHEEELSRMKGSWSWALTAHARAATRAGRRVRDGIRNRVARTIERAYRMLPVSHAYKQRAKGLVFRMTGDILRNTRAYQRWQAYERICGGASLPLPSNHTRPIGTPEPTPVALWQADGIREWAEYQPLRDRIDARLVQLREAEPPKARAVLDFSNQDVSRATARIRLAQPPRVPDVTILIPVYNHLVTTLECLASIAATADAAGPSFEVIIADDASTDDTAQVLASIPNLRLVSQPRNLGFLRNCNTVAQHARGRNLLLLNNDVQVTHGWLTSMVACLESDASIGAVGPRIVYPNGRLQEAGARLQRDGTAEMIGLNQRPDLPCFSYTREVDYCSGACLLLRSADFASLDGFDDRYAPAYCEDSDLCMRLRAEGKRIMYCAEAEIIHHLSKTSNGLDSDYKLACISRNLQTFTSTWQDQLDLMDEVRTIAFYLPQFHPIPENDLWWGRGFTEWTNVTKARPNFVGHYQPRVPSDLGYYDLRLTDVMRQQAELAKRYGIHGFCFYYYWFGGERLLEHPIEQMLANDDLDMPFCLCWANENWTRRWDGQEQEILMAQRHSREDDLAVIHDLMRYFQSPNYIRVNGRPLLLVYRVALFPDFAETARLWRETCRTEGIGEIYLVLVESFELTAAGTKPDHFGCDAAVEFPPHGMAETYPLTSALLNPDYQGAVADYRDLALRYATRPHPDYKRFPGVVPGWDNTARRQNHSYVFEQSTPGAFQAWLETTVTRTKQQYCGDERLVFINAWNEWAEGAYLEPDQRFGHTFLEGVRNAQDAAKLMRHASYSLGD